MKSTVSLTRRIASAVFVGIGGVFLVMIPFPLVSDWEDGKLTALGLWFAMGVGFLLLAYFVRRAHALGLLACLLVNVALIVWSWGDAKVALLVLPLSASLLCLALEEYRLIAALRKRTA